jgi:WD40 repeat protein
VSRIFLSHSSQDNREALALKQWLSAQRPELATEIFLDIDPASGLQAGARWKGQLFDSNSRCQTVICLLSRSWEASHECKTEYRTAEGLGKQIIVARLEDRGDTDITSEWQRCDLFAHGAQTEIIVAGGPAVRFNTAALDQLKKSIEGTGIGPECFVWPPSEDPQRAPYRGWAPFEDIDAGVFFGRDAAIAGGLDDLRAMRFGLLARLSGYKSLFVVLGPSGSGKSSFLRAGLIPRLRRDDRRFLVLGLVRPEHNSLTGDHGLAAAIHSARVELGLSSPPLGDIKSACLDDPDWVCELLVELRIAAAKRLAEIQPDETTRLNSRPQDGPAPEDGACQPPAEADDAAMAPTLVLPLDQAEELFSADAGPQAGRFLTLIARLLDRINADELGMIVAATIRTDRFEAMQSHPALDGLGTELFDELKPMPATQFKEVITGPAVRTTEGGQRLSIAPDLVNQLIADSASGADTLPLLALTLARLYADYASTGELTLAHYESTGGMRRVVNNRIDEVLSSDAVERAHQLEQLRAAFIPWLATINPDNDQPLRRVARYADLPEASRPVIDALVDQRLLVRDEREGEVVIEVALESLLRQWDVLAGWLRQERQHLKTADNIEHNAGAWEDHDRDPAWLLTGTRLTDAEALAAAPGFSARLEVAHDYLAASRKVENQNQAAEEERRQAELRYARERQQTAEAHAGKLRIRSAILAVVAVVAVATAVTAFFFHRQTKQEARDVSAERISAEAMDMLNGDLPGGDVFAVQEMLAANSLASDTTTGEHTMAAALKLAWASKLMYPYPSGLTETAAYSPDGHRVVSGGFDGEVQIWDADTGAQIKALKGHSSPVSGVAFSPDGRRVVAANDSGELSLWDADNYAAIAAASTPTEGSAIRTVAFSPDGRHIGTGGSLGDVRVWDAQTLQPSAQLVPWHTGEVAIVAFSPDGRILASGSRDTTIRLWNADTGQPIGEPLRGHRDAVKSVAFSSDGHRLASGSADTTVWIWDVTDSAHPVGRPLADAAPDEPQDANTAPVNSVAFNPSDRRGSVLITGSADGSVRWWQVDSGYSVRLPLTTEGDSVEAVAFGPGGSSILSCRTSGIQIWSNPAMAIPLGGHTDTVWSVAFGPDGRRIVSGSKDKTLRLWNADTGQPVGAPLTGHTAPVNSVAFSPDGHRIVSGSRDDTLRLWSPDTGQPVGAPLTGHTAPVNSVAFSSDGHRIVSGSDDKTLRLWNADTGQPVGAPLTGHTAPVNSVAFSPDGHHIVSGSRDDTLRLWNADTGQPIEPPLTGHTDSVRSVAFSPDGQRIVSGSYDGTVRIWDTGRRQQVVKNLTGHAGRVYAVVFSPDGRYVASGGEDGTIRIYDSQTTHELGAPLSANARGVYALAFSTDERTIVTSGADRKLHLWPFPGKDAKRPWDAAREALCGKISANMSREQWAQFISRSIGYIAQCPLLIPDQRR